MIYCITTVVPRCNASSCFVLFFSLSLRSISTHHPLYPAWDPASLSFHRLFPSLCSHRSLSPSVHIRLEFRALTCILSCLSRHHYTSVKPGKACPRPRRGMLLSYTKVITLNTPTDIINYAVSKTQPSTQVSIALSIYMFSVLPLSLCCQSSCVSVIFVPFLPGKSWFRSLMRV